MKQPKPIKLQKICLCCPASFMSSGPGNRICPKCTRKIDKDRSPPAYKITKAD